MFSLALLEAHACSASIVHGLRLYPFVTHVVVTDQVGGLLANLAVVVMEVTQAPGIVLLIDYVPIHRLLFREV